VFAGVRPTVAEVAAVRPGDDLVAPADVVMDRAFSLDAPPVAVWPWMVQLGKRRAGWYLPRRVERFVPRTRRGLRVLDPRWQQLAVGEVIPDYGGRDATFEVASIEPPASLVYRSTRGDVHLSWSITLIAASPSRTRVHLRLRLAPIRHRRLAEIGGGILDLLTVAGMAAGLRERVETRGSA